jgi:hypothetical protein
MERRRKEIVFKSRDGSEISIRGSSHISRGLDPLMVLYGLVSSNLQSLEGNLMTSSSYVLVGFYWNAAAAADLLSEFGTRGLGGSVTYVSSFR